MKLWKEKESSGNVLVIAENVGCIAVCVDDTHADYVINALNEGRYRVGNKGIEVVE